ncbi:hypothetical protein D3C73_1540420 [compost metagenome]
MLLILQQRIKQVVHLDLQLIHGAVGRHRYARGHILRTLTVVEPPFNRYVEGVGL